MSDLFMDMHQQQAKSRTASYNGSDSMFGSLTHADEQDDAYENVLSLKLKKPKHWKWELNTSRSCTNISLPRIILYDHKGKLLVDTNHSQEEQTIRQEDVALARKRAKPKRAIKAATANLTVPIRQVLDSEFDDLCIAENIVADTPSSKLSPVHSLTPTSIDFYTQDLPDFKLKSQSSSFKEVRFKVDDKQQLNNGLGATTCSFNLADLPTPPSTTTPASTSTSSGPQEKRRYRRSRSSGRSSGQSESILERFSLNRGRFSSPEYAEEQQSKHSPRYYLATSKAGTLVLQHESFSRYRRRRKTKHSSSENIQSNDSRNPLQLFNNEDKQRLEVPCASLQNISATPEPRKTRRKALPLRRNRSDGIILQRRLSSTTDEEIIEQRQMFPNFRRQNKKDVVAIDADNGVLGAQERPTGR